MKWKCHHELRVGKNLEGSCGNLSKITIPAFGAKLDKTSVRVSTVYLPDKGKSAASTLGKLSKKEHLNGKL
jgi:hypothetical protein